MSNKFDAEFYYKDSRSYVHSSTQCARLVEILYQQMEVDLSSFKLDAKFSKFMTFDGEYLIQFEPFLKRQKNTVSEFKLFSESKVIYAQLNENDSKILSRKNTNYSISKLEGAEGFSGKGSFLYTSDIEFFENIIEINKRLHLQGNAIKNLEVINLYMKNLPLKYSADYNKQMDVEIKNISLIEGANKITTLNEFAILSSDVDKFNICFQVITC